LVQKRGEPSGRWFEGRVHVVRKEDVGLRFHMSFTGWTRSQRYKIRFKLNRVPLRRQHQALAMAFSPDRLLFPEEDHILDRNYRLQADVRLRPYNRFIGNNPLQLQAVISIAYQQPGSLPFAVFGPSVDTSFHDIKANKTAIFCRPGTGKTVTIVEAIRQILRRTPKARILACAPSNSAADLIASRLNALSTQELFRFYAPSRHKELVPDDLGPYSSFHNDHFSCPPMAILKRFKVIVCTCVSAAFAHGIGLRRGHFTHIFVDEAGQATEAEVMVPIKTMADVSTNVILAGDPKQLGPIIRSDFARELGLETSYLERLMKTEVYDEKKGYGKTCVAFFLSLLETQSRFSVS
jgi:helicase MOV-10